MRKIIWLLLPLISALSIGCSDDTDEDETQTPTEIVSPTAPAPAPAQTPSPSVESCGDLTGRIYNGVDGQGGEPTEGCEGCGNRGMIQFETAKDLTYLGAGDDQMWDCTYRVNELTLKITCEAFSDAMVMQFSSNCHEIRDGNLKYVHVTGAR